MEICKAMEELVNDAGKRAVLIARGRERARQFTWQRTAAKFLDIVANLSP